MMVVVNGAFRTMPQSKSERAGRGPSGTATRVQSGDLISRLQQLLAEMPDSGALRSTGAGEEPSIGGSESHTPPEEALPGADVVLDVESSGLRCIVIRPTVHEEEPRVHLSPREMEIARMVAKGYPNKTIAGVLEISPWTVSAHLRRIFAKFRVTSRAAMVAHFLQEGATLEGESERPSGEHAR
jgi:DNA-binding CsgD family transcriptional regulator